MSIPEAENKKNPELKEYFDNSYRAVGSYWPKGSMRPGTGLSLTEENILMPYILNIPFNDRDFREKVTQFFHDITTKVEPTHIDVKGIEDGGTKLEIGLHNNEEEVGELNLPNNIMDFIRYRQIIGHPQVAISEEASRGNQLKIYFIYNPTDVTRSNNTLADMKDTALEAYLGVKKDAAKVVQYLTLLGVNSQDFKGSESVKLRELSIKDPEAFMKVHLNKHKDYKYLIMDLITANVLEQIGSRIVIKESSQQIGGNLKEAIAYLMDPANSKQLTIFKANVQDYKKSKNLSLAELDEAEPPITTTTAE